MPLCLVCGINQFVQLSNGNQSHEAKRNLQACVISCQAVLAWVMKNHLQWLRCFLQLKITTQAGEQFRNYFKDLQKNRKTSSFLCSSIHIKLEYKVYTDLLDASSTGKLITGLYRQWYAFRAKTKLTFINLPALNCQHFTGIFLQVSPITLWILWYSGFQNIPCLSLLDSIDS